MIGLKHLLLLSIFLVIQKTTAIKQQSTLKSTFCSKTVWYTQNKVVERSKLIRKIHHTWCLWIPPKCATYSYDTVYFNETIPVKKSKIILDCCPGYKKRKDDCIPVCKKSCGHGKCIEPDVCLCDEGWKDPDCLTECQTNRYGKGCKDECTCFNGATCDKKNGFCYCAEGYAGVYCEKTCPNNAYGLFCSEKCDCENGALCDPKNGSCTCQPGYVGEHCEKPCESGFHGPNCENECVCLNETTDSCNHENGTCVCKPGYRGKYCEKNCWNFTYGADCNSICHCLHSDFCDPVIGKCNCNPGWIGKKCDEKCPYGMFGQDCSFRCGCDPSSVCDHVTGSCDCPPGRGGKFCERACHLGTWGKNCSKHCNCDFGNVCDAVTGLCLCKYSLDGSRCSVECNNGTLGSSCSLECNCSCNEENGICSGPITEPDKKIVRQAKIAGKFVGYIIGLIFFITILCIIAFMLISNTARGFAVNRYVAFRDWIRNRNTSTREDLPSPTFSNPLYASQRKSAQTALATVEDLSIDFNPPVFTIENFNSANRITINNVDENKESAASTRPALFEKHRSLPERMPPTKIPGRNSDTSTPITDATEGDFKPEELTSFNIYDVMEIYSKAEDGVSE